MRNDALIIYQQQLRIRIENLPAANTLSEQHIRRLNHAQNATSYIITIATSARPAK